MGLKVVLMKKKRNEEEREEEYEILGVTHNTPHAKKGWTEKPNINKICQTIKKAKVTAVTIYFYFNYLYFPSDLL